MNQRPFIGFTDKELVEIWDGLDAAAGEGDFDNDEIARALAEEAHIRGIKLTFGYLLGGREWPT